MLGLLDQQARLCQHLEDLNAKSTFDAASEYSSRNKTTISQNKNTYQSLINHSNSPFKRVTKKKSHNVSVPSPVSGNTDGTKSGVFVLSEPDETSNSSKYKMEFSRTEVGDDGSKELIKKYEEKDIEMEGRNIKICSQGNEECNTDIDVTNTTSSAIIDIVKDKVRNFFLIFFKTKLEFFYILS